MSYDKPMAAARETPISDESHLVPEPAPHDGGGRTQHLAHSRPTYRPLVPDDDDVTGSTAAGQERREKLTEDTDDLLDEIDDVLEENAEDFVRAYVQKGGQ